MGQAVAKPKQGMTNTSISYRLLVPARSWAKLILGLLAWLLLIVASLIIIAGAAEQATQKTDEKDGKAAGKTNDAKELINFMEQIYDRKIKPGIEFDDFYHAIHDMVE